MATKQVRSLALVIFLLSVVAFLLPHAHAGNLRFPNPFYPVGPEPRGLVASDFNGDGITDLAVAHSGGNVSVLLGRTDGSFGPAVRYPTGFGSRGIVVADFDSNNIPDLAVSNASSSDVSILLGRGDGSFAPEVRVAMGRWPTSVAVGDLNGDRVLDLVVSSSFTDELAVRLGLGPTAFADEVRFGTGTYPQSVVIGDMNGDGTPDLVNANTNSGDLSILIGVGDGTFSPALSVPVASNPMAVAIADFDRDGIPDLGVAVGSSSASGVYVLLGREDGTFEGPTFNASSRQPDSIEIEDVDGDGLVDISVSSSQNDASVLLGRGDGTFAPDHRVGTGEFPSDIDYGDINGDGLLDFFAANRGSEDVVVLLGHGDGTFGALTLPGGPYTQSVAVGYLDADSALDLAVASETKISVYLGDGSGNFGAEHPYVTNEWSDDLVAGDVNQDGFDDLVMPAPDRYSVAVLMAEGDGNFSPGAVLPGGDYPYQVIVDHIDGDLALDVAALDGSSGDIFVMLGNNDGTFSSEIRSAGGHLPWDLVAGDFDSDGRLDVALPIPSRRQVSVLLGEGDGRFSPGSLIPVDGSPSRLAVADFDSDQVDDLVAVSGRGDQAIILIGDGNGSFSQTGSFPVGEDPFAAATGDFDLDGLMDVAVTARWGTLSILLGRGDGSFEPEVRFRVGNSPYSIVVADLDEDGRPDIVVGSDRSDDATVLLNETVSNEPPSANAGVDSSAECTSPAGASVVLDGSGSSDPDSTPGTNDDIVAFEWFVDFDQAEPILLGVGSRLPVTLALGRHEITLRVTDRAGAQSTDSVVVTVVDTVPPDLLVTPDPDQLWPPNHRMVRTQVVIDASDVCSEPTIRLVAVTSDESDDAPGSGDGATTNDIAGAEIDTPDFEFELRAERNGAGNGRTYTLTYEAIDLAGNSTTASALVVVPHDRSGHTSAMEIELTHDSTGTVVHWSSVSDAYLYDVIRGRVENIASTQSAFRLGPVSCIEAGSLNENTAGHEDPDIPPSGVTFFYLVEYDDGSRSSYGSTSADKPRLPGSGGCR